MTKKTTIITDTEAFAFEVAMLNVALKARALDVCDDLALLLDSPHLDDDDKAIIKEQILFVNSW